MTTIESLEKRLALLKKQFRNINDGTQGSYMIRETQVGSDKSTTFDITIESNKLIPIGTKLIIEGFESKSSQKYTNAGNKNPNFKTTFKGTTQTIIDEQIGYPQIKFEDREMTSIFGNENYTWAEGTVEHRHSGKFVITLNNAIADKISPGWDASLNLIKTKTDEIAEQNRLGGIAWETETDMSLEYKDVFKPYKDKIDNLNQEISEIKNAGQKLKFDLFLSRNGASQNDTPIGDIKFSLEDTDGNAWNDILTVDMEKKKPPPPKLDDIEKEIMRDGDWTFEINNWGTTGEMRIGLISLYKRDGMKLKELEINKIGGIITEEANGLLNLGMYVGPQNSNHKIILTVPSSYRDNNGDTIDNNIDQIHFVLDDDEWNRLSMNGKLLIVRKGNILYNHNDNATAGYEFKVNMNTMGEQIIKIPLKKPERKYPLPADATKDYKKLEEKNQTEIEELEKVINERRIELNAEAAKIKEHITGYDDTKNYTIKEIKEAEKKKTEKAAEEAKKAAEEQAKKEENNLQDLRNATTAVEEAKKAVEEAATAAEEAKKAAEEAKNTTFVDIANEEATKAETELNKAKLEKDKAKSEIAKVIAANINLGNISGGKLFEKENLLTTAIATMEAVEAAATAVELAATAATAAKQETKIVYDSLTLVEKQEINKKQTAFKQAAENKIKEKNYEELKNIITGLEKAAAEAAAAKKATKDALDAADLPAIVAAGDIAAAEQTAKKVEMEAEKAEKPADTAAAAYKKVKEIEKKVLPAKAATVLTQAKTTADSAASALIEAKQAATNAKNAIEEAKKGKIKLAEKIKKEQEAKKAAEEKEKREQKSFEDLKKAVAAAKKAAEDATKAAADATKAATNATNNANMAKALVNAAKVESSLPPQNVENATSVKLKVEEFAKETVNEKDKAWEEEYAAKAALAKVEKAKNKAEKEEKIVAEKAKEVAENKQTEATAAKAEAEAAVQTATTAVQTATTAVQTATTAVQTAETAADTAENETTKANTALDSFKAEEKKSAQINKTINDLISRAKTVEKELTNNKYTTITEGEIDEAKRVIAAAETKLIEKLKKKANLAYNYLSNDDQIYEREIENKPEKIKTAKAAIEKAVEDLIKRIIQRGGDYGENITLKNDGTDTIAEIEAAQKKANDAEMKSTFKPDMGDMTGMGGPPQIGTGGMQLPPQMGEVKMGPDGMPLPPPAPGFGAGAAGAGFGVGAGVGVGAGANAGPAVGVGAGANAGPAAGVLDEAQLDVIVGGDVDPAAGVGAGFGVGAPIPPKGTWTADSYVITIESDGRSSFFIGDTVIDMDEMGYPKIPLNSKIIKIEDLPDVNGKTIKQITINNQLKTNGTGVQLSIFSPMPETAFGQMDTPVDIPNFPLVGRVMRGNKPLQTHKKELESIIETLKEIYNSLQAKQ